MNKKENMKRILSSCIVLSMILTGFAVIAPTGPISTIVTADDGQNQETHPSIRMYGEEHAVYPTQSYRGKDDFIYPDPSAAFEPGIISKDSITFNPAFLDLEYHGEEITISDSDASEKVFFRMFYEPEYTHGTDSLMESCSGALLEPVETFDAIVTETTYFTVDHTRRPLLADNSSHIMLPCNNTNPDVPGMDTATVLDLAQVEPEMIWVEDTYSLGSGQSMNFMDHTITFNNYQTDLNKVKVEIKYDGNMYGAHSKEKTRYLDIGTTYYFNRNNNYQDFTDPCHRWYMKVFFYNDNTIDLKIGRVLAIGETFYVNGVRYDMPYIYTMPIPGTKDYGFEYITFQSPIPKCPADAEMWYTEDLDDNYNDWSHVTSQWLANLRPGYDVWVLPPFNEEHIMIDDIGIEKIDNGWYDECDIYHYDWEIPSAGIIYEDLVDALQFYYIIEYYEPRFDSSLTERFYAYPECYYRDDTLIVDDCEGWYNDWTWFNVNTKPNRFTEFVLPDQEMTGGNYDVRDIPAYYLNNGGPTTADGYEYLLTSSFISPNSDDYYDLDTDRWTYSKEYYYQHDILDKSVEIENYEESQSRGCFYDWPRMTFEFDAVDGTDIYVNDIDDQTLDTDNDVSVRIYGEEDFVYPTHSWSHEDPMWYDDFIYNEMDWEDTMGDFIYPNNALPFYPGSIPKDSITFNPAFIDMEYHGEEINVNGGDSSEKVFYRTFYEPEYNHTIDRKMDYWTDSALEDIEPFDAIVTETTYLLVDHDRWPVAGKPIETDFMLPYKSSNPDQPGMDTAMVLQLADVGDGGTDYVLTDGNISVETTCMDMVKDDSISFMDHTITFHNYNIDLDQIRFEVKYDGNMYGAHDKEKSALLNIGETYYFDRNNDFQTETDPAHRWYISCDYYHEEMVDGTITGYVDITVGRVLVAGETFYVNGVRYDMPAICVEDVWENGEFDYLGFKYITLQTPIPKCEPGSQTWYTNDLNMNYNDWTHVTSQWLANLMPGEAIWVLPPFNEQHYMVDDIGLMPYDYGWYEGQGDNKVWIPNWEVPFEGLLLDEMKDPLVYCYASEDYEWRFDSSLAERLYMSNNWRWFNVFTKPIRYTEFVLPDQEVENEQYAEDWDWYPYDDAADGFEYLIGTSFLAPNCNYPDFEWSKWTDESHDIIDIYWMFDLYDIDYYQNLLDYYGFYDCPTSKMTFEFDADDDTGIYMNGEGSGPGPEPEDEPPTAEANGPYSGSLCDQPSVTITFSCVGSHDNDESGAEIVSYRWDYDDDGIWDTTWLDFSDPTVDVVYTETFDGTARVQVLDDEGYTDTDTAPVEIVDVCVPATVIMEDVYLANEGTGSGRLKVANSDPALGSCDIVLEWNTEKVNITNIQAEDLIISYYNDWQNGILTINGYTSVGLENCIVAEITFEALVAGPDQCDLEITSSTLQDSNPMPSMIPHGVDNGIAYIGEIPNGDDGNMNGVGGVDSADVRYLALHIAGDPLYAVLHSDGDVNNDGYINSGDVRYLAMYLAGDPLYNPLYPDYP